MTRDQVQEFFRRLSEEMPEPETELEYQTPFELLVAVALSAQATDVSVNACTRKLFKVANTPEAILALGEEGLAEYIKTIGLWRNKAKNIIALCRMLIEEHGGEVPEDAKALMALPGVGRKTADVVLNVAFGHPTIAVDTHIFRVSNRTGLARGKTADQIADKLPKRVPPEYLKNAHHWLILHGRYVCKARTPECWRCSVADLCNFKPKTPPPDEQAAIKRAAKTKAKKKAVKRAPRRKAA
ncbi:endonuclease III [Parvularcula lutaonensis]|uniref:Endonuclease III n=1 Tax=Parvularcula lutaonensis TaxID=491923 RepID=A0ABV7M9G9_9PROT